MINNLHNFTINHYDSTTPTQEYDNLSIGNQNLKNQEVIEAKQTELRERAFTTFCLGNWDETHLDNLAQLAREINTKFVPYRLNLYGGLGLAERSEKDSYNENTSYICRAFVEGSPEMGFRVIEKEINFFADKSERLMKEPLVNLALDHIFKLLPGEMNPKSDRFEVSLIRQTASNMPELLFHRDLRHQVFVLVLACNFKEDDGAYLSIKDFNKFKDYSAPVNEKNSSYHEKHMTSFKGNGYLIRENTDSSPNTSFSVHHRRGPFSTSVENPERITLRILVDSQRKPATEAI